ncbi:MAG: hypothetical protein IIC29_07310 [Chloroflexi bacterium]|nr:hypothetical protein [Chloroflexota bacterium]MCH8816259.1 hypothetical protein [Chloroflexota bacterium]
MPFFLAAAVCCIPIAIAAVVAVRGLRSRAHEGDETELDLRDAEKPAPELTAGEEQSR